MLVNDAGVTVSVELAVWPESTAEICVTPSLSAVAWPLFPAAFETVAIESCELLQVAASLTGAVVPSEK